MYPLKDRTYRHTDKNGTLIQQGDHVKIPQDFIGMGGWCVVKEDNDGLFLQNLRTKRELYLDLVLSSLLTKVF